MARITYFTLIFFMLKEIKGGDPFEDTLSTRFECYGMEQPGCTTDFIDARPKLAMSHNNMTKATTHIYLFTPNNVETPELFHKCPDAVPPKTLFNPKCRTDILIPGFVSGICNFAVFREIKNEMLKKGCYNMLLIDWMWGNTFDPQDTFYNAKHVAKQVAAVIDILKFTPLDDRLDPGDADCVQAIHTNDGQCLPFLGINYTIGTVDIYFNGGKIQEASIETTKNAFLKGDFVFGINSIFTGSHLQALEYYKASINADECKFIAVKCRNYGYFKKGRCASCGKKGQNCILVGPDFCDCVSPSFLNRKRTRKYYLDTDDHCPYCNNSKVDISGYHCETKYTSV
ncbi:inactive pancreatic lipase-related protein 1-like isoform X3 [Uloborus diversus]|uniref:inactive pancreatic lipase-related protein 1-like isoform X3 n=1 Tax=Uloborus diversus TaxID=327109 RepID=UPI0024098D05|nr:inactive pancreatic lipase-related protein 1-like isoform X3 [Uloborus diversus]